MRNSSSPGKFVRGLLALTLVLNVNCARSNSDSNTQTTPKQDQTEQNQKTKQTNRLANETSPYLLLHKNNPVDWYPWGKEAFDKAKRENKPIFLSIGYSSCYWCHVMERESFSDETIAKILNENFVCIKVDREELPDVDENYMTALQVMGFRGGWPLSAFLTPDRKPFFGGTYWPPADRPNMLGFPTVLDRVLETWKTRRADLLGFADRVTEAIGRATSPSQFSLGKVEPQLVQKGVTELEEQFDPQFGGFGYSPQQPKLPKFPQPAKLQLLLYDASENESEKSRQMVVKTLDEMERGGIWDHLGGGFHRYSTDRFWAVPHFEKMLYDNAQLATVYLEAYNATKKTRYRTVAEEIFEFVARDMTSPEGGFYSALDAESEHEEGKSYVWTKQEIEELLDKEQAKLVVHCYGLDKTANFEHGRHVLLRSKSFDDLAKELDLTREQLLEKLKPARAKLLAVRGKRPQPLLDTKVMTDWNGLMIRAYADGYRILKNEQYLEAAKKASAFILAKLKDGNGNLLHVYSQNKAKIPAYLDDYAYLVDGLVALHRASGEERWQTEAIRLVDVMVAELWDEAAGGFYSTSSKHDQLLARVKSPHDSVRPSGNSVAIHGLLALGDSTDNEKYHQLAAKSLGVFAGDLSATPSAQCLMLRAVGRYFDLELPADEIARVSKPAIVRAFAVVDQDEVKPGDSLEFSVNIEIEENWHIQANPASLQQLTATQVTADSELELEFDQPNYPESKELVVESIGEKIAVYEALAEISLKARVPADAKASKGNVTLTLRFQACDDQRCLAAREIELTVPITIAAP